MQRQQEIARMYELTPDPQAINPSAIGGTLVFCVQALSTEVAMLLRTTTSGPLLSLG